MNVALPASMRVLSLCAGVGMHDVGLHAAFDARTVCYVEREAFAASQLVGRGKRHSQCHNGERLAVRSPSGSYRVIQAESRRNWALSAEAGETSGVGAFLRSRENRQNRRVSREVTQRVPQ